MKHISNTDMICAIATPPGAGGLGVVRISGPKAFDILDKIWRSRNGKNVADFRRLYLGKAIAADGSAIDRIMAVKMPAPYTYTGQDVVELSCHGSPIVLKKIVKSCVEAGARVAEPGEFTRRAYLSGKMDLAQAEAVCDLISATSEKAAKLAGEQLEGKLSKEIKAIGSCLTDLRSFIEACIDFPEEEIGALEGGVEERLGKIANSVEALAETYDTGRLLRDGVRVVIIGKPNVGKSSILNRLVGCERVLVHHEPGTTRDVIEERACFGGIEFCFSDTAGMRHSPTEVESMGIDRACCEIEKSDLAIVVFDGSRPFDQEDETVLERCHGSAEIMVINKHDLPQRFDVKRITEAGFKGNIIHASAKTGKGIDELSKCLISHVITEPSARGYVEGVIVTSARHWAALLDAKASLKQAAEAYKEQEPLECIAQHLRIAQESLGAITGEVTTEDILDRIFSTFCIGK